MKVSLLAALFASVTMGAAAYAQDPVSAATDASAPAPTSPSGPVVAFSGSAATTMTAMTPEKAALGMLGAIAMAAEGASLIKEHKIQDPSVGMAKDLAAYVAASKSAQVAAEPISMERKGLPKPDVLIKAANGAAYVVDVDSGWLFRYQPTQWNSYNLMLTSRARVVDAGTGKIAANFVCKWDSKKAEPLLSKAELLDNGAQGLKTLLEKGGAACREELRNALTPTFGPPSPPVATPAS